MAELCQLYGCEKVRTTSYHPQGNGACERFNQTLISLLRSLEEAEQPRWPEKLPALLQAYNNTAHSCTGLTPHFVLHGRHARLPVEMATGAPNTRPCYNLDGWVRAHHQTLLQAYHHVAAQTRLRQQMDKARYDSRIKHVPLLPGERVLLRNFRRHDQGKLAPHWQSMPYVVVCQMRPHQPVYKIRPEGKEGLEKIIHRNNIRQCPLRLELPSPPGTAQPMGRSDRRERLDVAPPCLVPFTPVALGQLTAPGPVADAAPAPSSATTIESHSPSVSGEPLLRRSTRETRGRVPLRYNQ